MAKTKIKFNGSIEDLADLGNVGGDLPQRQVIPCMCSEGLHGLVLKQYIMKEAGKISPSKAQLMDVTAFLKREVAEGNLKPLSGMGFSIMSNAILNVCRWDTEYIDVVVPQIYVLDKGLWVPQEVEKVGAFCSGEKRVYDHENNAWLGYLYSRRTVQNKLDYLTDFLCD